MADLDVKRRNQAQHSSRAALTRARWIELAAAAAVSSAIILVVATIVRTRLPALWSTRPWMLLAVGVCVAVAALRTGGGRWRAFLGVRHFFTYPPLWVAGVLGAAITMSVFWFAPHIADNIGVARNVATIAGPLAAGVAALVVVLGVVAVCCSRRSDPVRATAPASEASAVPTDTARGDTTSTRLPRSYEDLAAWLQTDAPIERKEDDTFGHWCIAERIVSRLMDAHPPAQAVVGRLGTGKSTLRKLVVSALQTSAASQRIDVVDVELWVYETTRAAVEGVIGALVQALSQRVNVVALRGLPASYVEAMSVAGGIWATLGALQASPRPVDVLRRIDRIASAIGHRYVVWVEDLERFSGTVDGPESADDAERLNPIRALLFALDQLESVTVVTATTSLHSRFDIEKIARFVEYLQEVPPGIAGEILGTFRNGTLARHEFIDLATPAIRAELQYLGSREGDSVTRAMLGPGVRSIRTAVTELCRTPRTLKQSLRMCLDVWDRLAGELDFDDLFVMSVLREAQPSVFALVCEHADSLRQRPTEALKDETRKAKEAWEVSLQAQHLEPRTLSAVREVVDFVFGPKSRTKHQGFAQEGPRDYWNRFLSVPRLGDRERDQLIVRTLLADDDDSVLDALQDDSTDGRSDAVEAFRHLVPTERLLRLLVPLVQRRSTDGAQTWDTRHPPGLLPLWRMWLRRAESQHWSPKAAFHELQRAFDIAVPTNLALTAEIEHYFATGSSDIPDLLGNEDGGFRRTAKAYARELLVATYTGKPDELARALTGARLPALLWLCWGIDQVRAGTTEGEPFPGWRELAPTILEAATREPLVMLPQLAGLVTRESTHVTDDDDGIRHGYTFNAAGAEGLFGSSGEVLDVFEGRDRQQWADDPPVGAVFRAVDERAALQYDHRLASR